MDDNDCTCRLQTGRPCPVHPHNPVDFRTMHGPPLPPETEAPWIALEDEDACFADWDAQIADRTADLASKADAASEEAAAAAVVADQQQPGQREAFDRVFAMTPAELGEAAVEGARKTRGPGRGRGGPFDPRGCF